MEEDPTLHPLASTNMPAHAHAHIHATHPHTHKHKSIEERGMLLMLTSLRVGLPMKKSVFLLLLGGLNLGFRKAQPFAMASRGAGPS